MACFEYVWRCWGRDARRGGSSAGRSGAQAREAKRRQALHEGGREDPERMLETAETPLRMRRRPSVLAAIQAQPHAGRSKIGTGPASRASIRRSSSAAKRPLAGQQNHQPDDAEAPASPERVPDVPRWSSMRRPPPRVPSRADGDHPDQQREHQATGSARPLRTTDDRPDDA